MPHHTNKLRWTLVGVCAVALAGSPVAFGAPKPKAPKDQTLLSGERNPKRGELAAETSIIAKTDGYALRATNTQSGGAGIFSCETGEGGTAGKRSPCVRAVNRGAGSVFEFNFIGTLGGVFQVGPDINRAFPAARPFVTNATGVATGLNADRVDGLHAQDIIDTAVDRASLKVGAQGPTGAAGPAGARGPQGLQGQSGPPGTPLVAARSTPVNAGLGNRRVVALPNRTINSTEPAAASDGVDLLSGLSALPPLDPDSTYLIQVTLRAFDNGSTSTAGTKHYAVAGLFVDGVLQQTLWTPDVPADGSNAATASDTAVVTVTSPSAGAVSLRGVVHTDDGTPANTHVAAGATVIVTQVNPGS